jgi:hypothetical protein
MKLFVIAMLSLVLNGFAFAGIQGEKIVAGCGGRYTVIYEGDSAGFFGGFPIVQSTFFIADAEGQRYYTALQVTAEGGRLTADYDTFKLVYEEGWGHGYLMVTKDGLTELIDCKK